MANPPNPAPPQMQAAQQSLARAIAEVEKRPVDLLAVSWDEIEKSVIKLLGGPFKLDRPDHQALALGLAATLAARLSAEHGAFWFPQRDSLEGAALGFPEALVTLSPFGAVLDALSQSKLQRLEQLSSELRRSLAAAKFSISGGAGGAMRLRPDDYVRLFDAGFVQLTALDPAKAKQVWEGTPSTAARELRDALSRATQLPAEARKQVEAQLVGTLTRMDPQKPLQMQEAGGLVDLLGHLFASKAATGIGPEELWQEIALPLAMIGAPAQFPPVDAEDLEAYREGAPVVALYVDLVPYNTPSADEDGLLGVIPMDQLSLPAGAPPRTGMPRLLHVKPDALRGIFKSFDAAKARDALQRFSKYLEEKAGKKGPEPAQARHMEDAAFTLLEDTARVLAAVDKGAELYVRRLTEAEAASEPALSLVRDALQGPRIILA